ncbi:MAG: hypothetical protein Ct9H300mP27_07860 [Chloroflexota bacterium]|nr:MAG: hypothetical protein Ct9H300mP27_07860 [Chloroflexota bacterium]
MGTNNVVLKIENSVATLSLNRPDALNALSVDLLNEFYQSCLQVEEDASVKALLIRGEGRAFCAGADLLYFESILDDLQFMSEYVNLLNKCLSSIGETYSTYNSSCARLCIGRWIGVDVSM